MPQRSSTSVLVVLTFAMGIGPLLNVGMSATSSLIIRDLGITLGQYGFFSTVCFTVAALSSLTLGRVSDRWSDRTQLVFIFGGAALSFIVAALTMSFLWLVGAVAISGVAQAMTNPSTNRWTVQHAPVRKRSAWIGVKQSGPQASQLFAGLFYPIAAIAIGWRGAAAASAVLALVMLVWAWNKIPNDSAQAQKAVLRRVEKESHGEKPGAGHKHGRRVWIFSTQLLLASIGLTATNVYLPLFAQVDLEFSLVLAGLAIATVGLIGVVFRILWARSMAAGRSTNTLMLVLAVGSVAGGVCLLLAGELRIGALLWAGVFFHGAMALGSNVVVMAGVMRSVRTELAGSATGIVSLGLYAGIAAGPLIMGLIVDRTDSFSAGWAFVVGVNVVSVLLAVMLRLRGRE